MSRRTGQSSKPLVSRLMLLIGELCLGLLLAPAALTAGTAITDSNPMRMPAVDDYCLRVLSPTLLELTLISTKPQGTTPVTNWNFVANNALTPPPVSDFSVTAGGQPIAVQSVGFKRRALYAPLNYYDLRIGNYLYLQLSTPISDGQPVKVTNPRGDLWSADKGYAATADPMRFNPAIHVNQEGYMPNFAKKAMVGYYLGSMGELPVPASAGFKIVSVATGQTVYSGALAQRKDSGYSISPAVYQQVYEADFSSFNTPGEYRIQVPGLGASMPFMIDPGIAALYTRTYALGLYHQRCGFSNDFPYTRFVKGACHTAAASVPDMSYAAVNSELANMTSDYASSQAAGTPQLKDVNSSLYPFINKGPIDVSGGHHDAGDYSKYTINIAQLIHSLVFAADAFPGVGSLDNLGLPESGDGKSDLLQEAKWEADFLLKLQDADGGFYFLVYPRNREYESDVSLTGSDLGDPQVVFPKTTAVTAASVGALAEAGSSPLMKAQFPAQAAAYLAAAQKGWQFLQNAIAKYGRDGSYQKITHYGNQFGHNDELAWAAAALYAATGNTAYQTDLMAHFDPSDPNTMLWSWWRMFEGYGCAIRTYAFAARTGRLQQSQLDPTFLAKCEAQIVASGDDQVNWANDNAYANSFPDANKGPRTAGWFFSVNQAFDLATAYQITNKQVYIDTLIGNMNYEGGCNPLNMGFLTGVGWKRQRETVNQYAENDRRVLPPSGIPLGSVQTGFSWLYNYGSEPANLSFPGDYVASPYAPYDRWGDTFNTLTEFVNPQQGHSLAAVAFLMARTSLKTQAWKPVYGQISGLPTSVPAHNALTATLSAPGIDLSNAIIVWEARDQEPTPAANFQFAAVNVGPQWVEAEACLPDGRRVFAMTNFTATTATDTPPNSYESTALSPTTDMVALYHLDNGLSDACGRQASLTLSGNAALDPSNVGWLATANRTGSSLRFNDIGDQAIVTIPNTALVAANEQSISVEAMIYINAFKAYNRANVKILSLNQNWNASLEFNENMYYGARLQCGTSVDNGDASVVGTLTKNVWHHLRITINKTGYTVTVDGNAVLTQASSDLANWAANAGVTTLTLGNFDGWIDEVVVRNAPPSGQPANTLASPSINPAGGVFANSVAVSMSCPTAGSTLYYTLNGTTPTTASSVYTGPLTLMTNATITVIATASGMSSSAPVSATFTVSAPTVPATALPAPWTNMDIGSVGQTGSSVFANNMYSVKGSGADIWGTADACQFLYQPWAGDGEIVARVASIQNTAAWAKGGVMFRETLAANSTHAAMVLGAAGGAAFQYRATTAGNCAYADGGTVPLPEWVKLTRYGNVFTAFVSTNGTNWTIVGSQTIAMAGSIYVGLAACAQNNTALTTASFTGVKVTAGTTQPVTPIALTGSALGTSQGTYSSLNGVLTVTSSGFDIWGNADACEFVNRPCTNNGAVFARITGLSNTDPWAKAGVMFRASLDAGAANVAMLVSPTSGTVLQVRASNGASTSYVLGPLLGAPAWVELARFGNTFSGYVSADGINWTLVGSKTVVMPATSYAGLAVSSHSTATNTATFTSAQIKN